MRKIIVSMNVSLDGFIATPGGGLDWHFEKWTNEMDESLCEQLSKADTILLGRNTYNAMAAYWPTRALDYSYSRDGLAFAEMMNSYTKIVCSKTLTRPGWNNSRQVKSNIAGEVQQLKQHTGKDIIVFGSGSLVSSLITLGLIDEYMLWVHPVILSRGVPLFTGLNHLLNMQLVQVKKFRSGVIVLCYKMA